MFCECLLATTVKPTLDCPKEILADHFEADVMLKCVARANPALTSHSVYWAETNGRNTTLQTDGDKRGRYMFHATAGVSFIAGLLYVL